MTLPIVLDITHLVGRRNVNPHTGIDRVDISFAKSLLTNETVSLVGLYCAAIRTRVVPRHSISKCFPYVESHEHFLQLEKIKESVRSWLINSLERTAIPGLNPLRCRTTEPIWPSQLATKLLWSLQPTRQPEILEGSIYLNVTPYGTSANYYRRWLSRRPNTKAVFFVHDLLPIDHPEYFPERWQSSFRHMISVVMTTANGIIVASKSMQNRVHKALREHGRSHIPIHIGHLPPPPSHRLQSGSDQNLAAHPYFVVSGTIEPRKNHQLLLKLWRQLAEERQTSCPRLIVIGKRGWKSDTTIDLLKSLSNYVLEIGAIPDSIQHWLISNACATLFPSFAEGYGLPVVEALSLGVPTIASNIPVMREVSQGRAILLDPLDAPRWKSTVEQLSTRSTTMRDAVESARKFQPPEETTYFESVLGFLRSL